MKNSTLLLSSAALITGISFIFYESSKFMKGVESFFNDLYEASTANYE